MLEGIVDIGSNTVRLTVYECDAHDGSFSPFFKLKRQLGLVSHIDRKTSELDRDGVRALVETLDEYLSCSRHFSGLGELHVFATAALRRASNAREVIDEVKRRCGLDVDLVSGKEEARLGFVGARYQGGGGDGVQIDVGGGSSEVLVFHGSKVLESTSIPWGSLSLFEAFVEGIVPTRKEAGLIYETVAEELEKALPRRTLPCATCSGGTARSTLKLRRALLRGGDGSQLTRGELDELTAKALDAPRDFVRSVLKTVPERIHTCIPGICSLRAIADRYGVERLLVNDYGVREGYLLDRVLSRH